MKPRARKGLQDKNTELNKIKEECFRAKTDVNVREALLENMRTQMRAKKALEVKNLPNEVNKVALNRQEIKIFSELSNQNMREIGGKLININLRDNGIITRTRIIKTQYAKQRNLEEQKSQAISST